MPMRPQFSLIHSEFNDFLFAAVGEERSGIELTVLSALTRLGLDPWGEAARLSALPREAAARALAAFIAALPEGEWKDADSKAIATRLVKCLPGPRAAVASPPRAAGSVVKKTKSWAAIGVFCILLAAATLFVLMHRDADQAAAPAPPAAASTQR